MLSEAFSSEAFSEVVQTNDFHGLSGTIGGAFAGATGEAGFAGYAASGTVGGAFAGMGYSYGQVLYSGLEYVSSVGLADTSGGFDPIVYPSATRRGDLALLFIGWEASVSAGPEIPFGWTLVGSAIGPSSKPIGVLFAQIVLGDPTESFTIEVNNDRVGGGWLMAVFRRANVDLANDTSGNATSTTTIPMGNIQIDVSDNIAVNFVATTGTPSSITGGSVSGAQQIINNVEGAGDGGQTSLWALYERVASTGLYAQAAVTPNPVGSLSVNWGRVSVPVYEIGQWHFIEISTFGGAFAGVTGAIQMTRKVSGNAGGAFASASGAIVVNKSGREVGVASGSRNSYRLNGSANSVSLGNSQNSVTTTPVDKNRTV